MELELLHNNIDYEDIYDINYIVTFPISIIEKKEKLIEEIAYSIFDLKEIKKISIYVEDENINKYFKILRIKIIYNYERKRSKDC